MSSQAAPCLITRSDFAPEKLYASRVIPGSESGAGVMEFRYGDNKGAPMFLLENMTMMFTISGWKQRKLKPNLAAGETKAKGEKGLVTEVNAATATLEVPVGAVGESATPVEVEAAENFQFLKSLVARVQELYFEHSKELWTREVTQQEIVNLFSSPLIFKTLGCTWQFNIKRKYEQYPVRSPRCALRQLLSRRAASSL